MIFFYSSTIKKYSFFFFISSFNFYLFIKIVYIFKFKLHFFILIFHIDLRMLNCLRTFMTKEKGVCIEIKYLFTVTWYSKTFEMYKVWMFIQDMVRFNEVNSYLRDHRTLLAWFYQSYWFGGASFCGYFLLNFLFWCGKNLS